MSSIDDRIVRMEFDNKQFEQGVKNTMSTLEKLSEVLRFRKGTSGFEDIQRASEAVNFSPLTESLLQVQNHFSFFGQFAMNLFNRISNKIIDLGSTMVRELTTAPLRAGWSEYELQMTSTQTIMASTGKSIDEVTRYLDELNTYADKTIYSFSDMTSNIGKFTNAGVDLDVAVRAIQGISNEAAVSGANAAEASRAMYNFAQALSAGYVKLIDWKSIENANMATKEFKEQLLETAVAVGTVEKTADGMYRVLSSNANGGTMNDVISATKNFNDSLSYQWMTTDVLTQTLAKYADETTEIGRKAFAAATEVKTFSQLIDTVKESLGSGWTKSFTYIIGNLEEAKVLWTGVNNEINAILDPIAEAREEMLKFWHDNGGRDTAIQAIADAWQALKTVMDSVSGAFETVFPPMTGEKLVEITKSIGEMATKFKDFATSSELLADLKIIFTNLFTVAKKIIDVFGNLISRLSPLVDIFLEFGGSLYEAAYWLSLFLGGIAGSTDPLKALSINISTLKTVVRQVLSGIENLVKSLLELIGIKIEGNPITDLFDKLSKFASEHIDFSFLKGLSSLGQKAIDVFGALGDILSTVANFLLGGLGSAVELVIGLFDALFTSAENVIGAIKGIDVSFDGVGNVFGKFGEILANVGIALGRFGKWLGEQLPKLFSYLGSPEFHNIVSSFATLMGGGLLLSLKNFVDTLTDGKKKAEESKGIVDVLKDLLSGIPDKISDTFDALTGALTGLQDSVKGDALKKIAIAIGILAGSLVLLSIIEPERMASAISGISAAMGVLIGTFKALEGSSAMTVAGGMSSISTTLVKMAIAVGILAIAMKALSGLSMDEVVRGLTGLAGTMAVLVIGVSLLARFGGKIDKTAKGMITLSIAIGILAISVRALSKLNMDELERGLIGVGILLGEISAFSQWTSGGGLSVSEAASILVLAAAFKVLSSTVEFFAGMDWDKLGQGLLGVGILLGEIAAFSQYFEGQSFSAGGVATILSFVIAVKVLESSVKVFAEMDWDKLGQGLLGVFGLMAAIGGFAVFIGNSSLTASAAASVVILALVVKMLADTVMSFSGMSWQEMAVGLGALAGIVATMVAALMMLELGSTSMLAGAAAMTVMAIALRIFVPVLEKLSDMEFGKIVKGFLTLAAALALLGFGSVVLSAIAPEIIVASIAIGAFGIACGLFGAGIAIISAGMMALGPAVAIGVSGLIAGIVAFLEGIDQILVALGGALESIKNFLIEQNPFFIELVSGMILSVLSALPPLIPALVGVIGQFLIALMTTLITWLPVIANLLVVGVVTLINSVANGIRDNGEAILASVRNILSSIIELVLTALADIVRMIPGVGETLAGFIEDGKEGVRQALAPESFEGMADDAISSMARGIANGSDDVAAAAEDVGGQVNESLVESADTTGTGDAILEPMLGELTDATGEIGDIGDGYLDELMGSLESGDLGPSAAILTGTGIDTLDSYIPDYGDVATNSGLGFANSLDSSYVLSIVRNHAANLTNTAINTMRNTAQVASPSRVTMRIGRYTGQGLALGIRSMVGEVYRESSAAGNRAIDGIRDSLGEMSKYLDDDLDVDPTIRPVMDLSEIQNGVGLMNRMVDNGIPDPLIGIGMNAYPQMMMSAMRGYSTASQIPSQVNAGETTTYNLYIDGVRVNADEDIRNSFIDLMYQLKAKERGYVG